MLLLALGAFCCGISGCTDGKAGSDVEVTKPSSGDSLAPSGEALRKALLGRVFVLQSVDGGAVPAGPRQPELGFDDAFRVAGRMCNQFTGPGSLEGGKLTVNHMASTKMLCIDKHLGQLEKDFGEAMSGGGMSLSLQGSTLVLEGGGHKLVYEEKK